MPLYKETWTQQEFTPKKQYILADVPEISTRALSELPFKFEDYKANQKLGCWQYERGLLECYNHLGVFETKKDEACFRIERFLALCKHQHKMLGILKTYSPEKFAVDRHARSIPNEREVLDF